MTPGTSVEKVDEVECSLEYFANINIEMESRVRLPDILDFHSVERKTNAFMCQ